MSQFCPDCGRENSDKAKFCASCGEKLSQNLQSQNQPSALLDNRYEILTTVKSGAMGCVYKARDTRLDTIVALKKMTCTAQDPNEIKYAENRFREEAKLLSELHHGGLPKVFDFFVIKELSGQTRAHYVAMTFIDGKDLETVIGERGKKPFPPDEALNYFRQFLEILQYLHSQKPPIIYRDIKPSNAILKDGKIFLVDFGIAKVLNLQNTGTSIGTWGYVAPEQCLGKAEPRSDIFGLGVLMHFLLTGADPLQGKMSPFKFEPPIKLNPAIPDYLNNIIISMLQEELAKRPASVNKIIETLNTSPQPIELNLIMAEAIRDAVAKAFKSKNIVLLDALICEGADVNMIFSENSNTMLHLAAWDGKTDMVRFLLSKKADVNIQNPTWKDTPLHNAAKQSHTEIVHMLVSAGADVNIKNHKGETPLTKAIHHNFYSTIGNSANHLKLLEHILLSPNIDIDFSYGPGQGNPNGYGSTTKILHWAVLIGSLDATKYLISKGAEINLRDSDGKTPMYYAKVKGFSEIVELLEKNGAHE